MNIICPECGQTHNLADDRLPKRRSAAKCKKCGSRIIIDPQPAPDDSGELNGENATTEQPHSSPEDFDVLLTENFIEHAEEEDVSSPPEEMEIIDILGKYNENAVGYGDDIYASFPELENLSPNKFNYGEIFSTTKNYGYQTREDTTTFKIIKAVHDLLTNKVLHEAEQVQKIAKGIAYFPFEIPYANGLLTAMSNYYAIVCTNQRLLLVNISSRANRPTRFIFQMSYEEISNINRSVFFSSLIIESKTGRSWNFTTVRRNLARSLRDFILEKSSGIKPTGHPEIAENNSQGQLCSACYTPLPQEPESCLQCSASYKKPTEAIIRSLILPGLGQIYLSYLTLGIMEITGYLAIWLIALILMIIKVPGGILSAIIPVLTYHLVSIILTRKTADKGYILYNNPAQPPVKSETNHESLPQTP